MKRTITLFTVLFIFLSFFSYSQTENVFGTRSGMPAISQGTNQQHIPNEALTIIYEENFNGDNTVAGLQARGWVWYDVDGVGLTTTFQGNATVFPSYEGPADGYVGQNFNGAAGGGLLIDQWLISPQFTVTAGDTVSFWWRAAGGQWDDSVFVLISDGGSAIPDFTLNLGRYRVPGLVWTRFTYVFLTSGPKRVALRYYHTNGGPNGTHSDYWGLDLFQVIAGTLPGPLNPFNLTSPSAGATVTSLPGSTTPVTISWDTSSATASYKWIFGTPTVPPRLLEVPVATNSLTITLGQLDDILAGLSIPQGGSVVGQWDVWAYRNNPPSFDSLKATNGPRAITLQRGIPALTPFNLVSPPNGTTLVTSVFNNNPVTINWTRSGAGVTYKWKFGVDVVANPILTVPSGNGGLDSSITLINSAIDGILAGLGLNPGDSVVGQWAVWAYSGNDSLKSAQTFAITLKRQAKGDVLIAYDSTLANGRISRDSVAAVLARNNITYDLFNKGGNTSTSAITLRGYKKVYWLGEGTSVMSNVQKDSIKAYLNSGTPTSKSNLIIFSEDVGYMLGRAASTYYDLDFVNNYLGWNFLLDRPASGANQGLIGLAINAGITDSTIGPWPDVLGLFGTTSEALYRFRYDPTAYSAIGNKTANFEVATFGVDVESLRPAIDSPPGSPVERMVMAAYNYLVIPVELSAFTANAYMNTVRLEWSTASELNNRGFEVERRLQGQEYQKIGFVEGKGTTTETQHYSFTDARLSSGTYSYRLKQIDFDGTVSYSSSVEVEVIQPVEFSLSQNYPNPFNPTTTIQFSLPMNSRVELKIFNVLGQEVRTLLNREMESGYHEINFDASELSSGVYFYKLESTAVNGINNSAVKKMILTK